MVAWVAMAPKMASQQNVSKCLQMSPKCLQNVSIETFSPYRLYQSLVPNILPGIGPQPRNADEVPASMSKLLTPT